MATKKATNTAKPAALKITPIDPVSEPKRKRKHGSTGTVPTAKIEDPLGEPADGEGKTYLGDESAIEASSEAPSGTPAESSVDEVHLRGWRMLTHRAKSKSLSRSMGRGRLRRHGRRQRQMKRSRKNSKTSTETAPHRGLQPSLNACRRFFRRPV